MKYIVLALVMATSCAPPGESAYDAGAEQEDTNMGLGIGVSVDAGCDRDVVAEATVQPHSPTLAEYHDNVQEIVVSGAVKRHNSFARLKFTTSGAQLRLGYWANLTQSASWLTILVDGVFTQSVTLTADAAQHSVDVTLSQVGTKTVDIWEGPLYGINEPAITTGGLVRSIQVLDGPMFMTRPIAPARRIVFYGDSISQGFPYSPEQSYIGLLRRDLALNAQIASYGSSGRSLYKDKTTIGLAALEAILASCLADVTPGGREDFVDVMGTNDWGNAYETAAAWQTDTAAVVDAIHAARPNAIAHLVSMLPRTGQATQNALGNTLADFRSAMAAVAATRAPWCVYHDASAVTNLATDHGDGVHLLPIGNTKFKAWLKANVL